MRKKIIHLILVMVAAAVFSFSICLPSHAYTEEEKAQAKAWLSAHGYSPDAGGASQAYQDYLDGKFDEELGISTTEAPAADEPEVTTEQSTKEDDEKEENGEKPEQTEEAPADSQGNLNTKKAETSEDLEADGKSRPELTESADEQIEEEPEDIRAQTIDGEKTVQTISLYRKENMDAYKEAGMIVVLSILLVAVTEGVLLLIK